MTSTSVRFPDGGTVEPVGDIDGHLRVAIVAPGRTVEQRMAALQTANRIRVERAKLKQALKAGSVSVLDVLREPDGYVMSMKVEQLLLALPKFGEVKARRVLIDCRISATKTVGGLSWRQRDELIARLGG